MNPDIVVDYKWQKLADALKQWDMIKMENITVNVDIIRRGNFWSLQVFEEGALRGRGFVYDGSGLFDRSIEWAEAQLRERDDVSRKSYDVWYFYNEQEAEKFKTLFVLKWAR